MSKNAKNEDKQIALADELDKWASSYGASEDSYVKGLSGSLRSGTELHFWATLDPIDYLPFPQVKAGAKLASRVRLILILRNVLVFAPVALTWIAVGEAVHAFGIYIRENTASVVNFLDFWENGYDILPHHYRIGEIAKLDAYIIFAVIILTLVAAILGQKAKNQQHSEEFLADRERMNLAVKIAHFLHDKQSVNTATINQAVIAAIGKLLSTSQALEETSRNMGKSVELTVKSVTQTLNSTTKEVSKTLNASTKSVSKTMDGTAKSLRKFLDASTRKAAKAERISVREFEQSFQAAEINLEDLISQSVQTNAPAEDSEKLANTKKSRWGFRGRS